MREPENQPGRQRIAGRLDSTSTDASFASPQSSISTLQSSIGIQARLPFRTAFRISVQGIRIRFGRSLVTLSGVVLGIAFLMSNLTGQLIKNAVATQEDTRQQANLMFNLVGGEFDQKIEGKKLAIAVFGVLSPRETEMVKKIVASKPASLRCFGVKLPGGTLVQDAKELSLDASLLLVLGNNTHVSLPLADLTLGMTRKVALDTEANRVFAADDQTLTRKLFFGAWFEQQTTRLAKQAQQARARTIWIVVISLLVTVIGVSNALLMSVTERFREIGTMKCLGALSSFIRLLFMIESSLIGLAGAIIGVLAGALLPMIVYGMTNSFSEVLSSIPYGLLLLAGLGSTLAGTVLAITAAIYPAAIASRMLPASALRSTV